MYPVLGFESVIVQIYIADYLLLLEVASQKREGFPPVKMEYSKTALKLKRLLPLFIV